MGLRPGDLEDLQPVDIWEMWKAWRWRWSRDLEARMQQAVISNPYAAGKVDPFLLCKEFRDYLPDPRRDDDDASIDEGGE